MDDWAWRLYAREVVVLSLTWLAVRWGTEPVTHLGAAGVGGAVFGLGVAASLVHGINEERRADAALIGDEPERWRAAQKALSSGELPTDPAHDAAVARLVRRRRDHSGWRQGWGGPSSRLAIEGLWIALASAAVLGRLLDLSIWVTVAAWVVIALAIGAVSRRQDRRRLDRLEAALVARAASPTPT